MIRCINPKNFISRDNRQCFKFIQSTKHPIRSFYIWLYAAHWPDQAREKDIAKYRAIDEGWDINTEAALQTMHRAWLIDKTGRCRRLTIKGWENAANKKLMEWRGWIVYACDGGLQDRGIGKE